MHAQVCGTQQEDGVIISQEPAATKERERQIAHRSVVVVINEASVEFLETTELQEANLHPRGWERGSSIGTAQQGRPHIPAVQ